MSTREFEPIAELGLLLLLFMTGLEINLKKLADAGRTLVTVGTAQFWICVAFPMARVIISTVPDSVLRGTTNLRLLQLVRGMAPHANVISTSDTLEGARQLYHEGAAYVLVARLTGAAELAPVVEAALDGGPAGPREHALAAIQARSEVLP